MAERNTHEKVSETHVLSIHRISSFSFYCFSSNYKTKQQTILRGEANSISFRFVDEWENEKSRN